jgi:hypothetical protein
MKDTDWVHLGKFDSNALSFILCALEEAGVAFDVVDDSVGAVYSPALGRMAKTPNMHDVYVPSERVDEAEAVLAQWYADAEAAAIRESGAPSDEPRDAGSSKPESTKSRPGVLFPVMLILIMATVFGGIWWTMHR